MYYAALAPLTEVNWLGIAISSQNVDTPSRHRGFSPPLISTDERLVEGLFSCVFAWDPDFVHHVLFIVTSLTAKTH